MTKKVIIAFGLLLFLLLAGYYVSKTSQEYPLLIKKGRYAMTVQFISDIPGFVDITERNDSLQLEVSSFSSESSGNMHMNWNINTNVPVSYNFNGRIKIITFTKCCGLIDKTITWSNLII